jgi:hypothetical protein
MTFQRNTLPSALIFYLMREEAYLSEVLLKQITEHHISEDLSSTILLKSQDVTECT